MARRRKLEGSGVVVACRVRLPELLMLRKPSEVAAEVSGKKDARAGDRG